MFVTAIPPPLCCIVCQEQVIPWQSILTSLPVWAIVVAHFAENWGFYTLLTEMPTFLSDVMDYELSQVSVETVQPF